MPELSLQETGKCEAELSPGDVRTVRWGGVHSAFTEPRVVPHRGMLKSEAELYRAGDRELRQR